MLPSILLPGLDGTGDLFDSFVAAAPAGFSTKRMRLPSERPRGYDELADWVSERLPKEPVVLIAESFSGPLAILVAERCPSVLALVLVATFVKAPLPSALSHIPKVVWSRPPPLWLLRFFMTGGDQTLAILLRNAISGVSPDVVEARIKAVLAVNVVPELRRFSRPVLCLQGEFDRVVPSQSAAMVRIACPQAEIHQIAAPHLLFQTKPAQAWSHIEQFLGRSL